MRTRWLVVATTTALCATLPGPVSAAAPAGTGQGVFPTLAANLVAHYDFAHPVAGNPALERDLGRSGTPIELVNGGAAMRVRDDGRTALRTKQVSPQDLSNDDWKAGTYAAAGVPSLGAFAGARQATISGWFKVIGDHPAPNTNTEDPADRYNAVGLAGVLTGDSDGHGVRALLEVIDVNGQQRVVALGRRVDGGSSQTFAADLPWEQVLPRGEWVFLTATFDYDTGAMALYRNGKPLSGSYVLPGDPWQLAGEPEPDLTSDTSPRGIKIGGSFPQNTVERNPCDCTMDDLMFFDRALTSREVWLQYVWSRR
jgi:concanavalin A-like lectin/glucanase superfamily protein